MASTAPVAPVTATTIRFGLGGASRSEDVPTGGRGRGPEVGGEARGEASAELQADIGADVGMRDSLPWRCDEKVWKRADIS